MRAGLTQELLAARLGIAHKNVQRIEAGQNLTLRTVERIARAIGVEVTELFAAPAAETGPMTARRPLEVLERAGIAVVPPGDAAGSTGAVPMVTLQAAAGQLGAEKMVQAAGWARIPGRRARRGEFLAQVAGASLEPRFPDGAWLLFRAPAARPFVGRVLLLARGLRGTDDDAFLLKKIACVRRRTDGASVVTLASFNPAYPPFDLVVRDQSDLRVVAEVIGVVAVPAGPGGEAGLALRGLMTRGRGRRG